MNPVHFSSATDNWATPVEFFNSLDRVFRFEVDVCASNDNHKCANYYTREQDGLTQDWRGVCWMNPPYGRGIDAWIRKAYESARDNGATVVCLVPARTDTRWWQNYCRDAEVYFVPGRIKFGDAKHGAPFPCAVVVFRPRVEWAFKGAA